MKDNLTNTHKKLHHRKRKIPNPKNQHHPKITTTPAQYNIIIYKKTKDNHQQ